MCYKQNRNNVRAQIKMKTRLLLVIGIIILAVTGVFFILSVTDYLTYLNQLEKEKNLSLGSSSPYIPSYFLHSSQNYEIVGIVLGVIGISILTIVIKKNKL